MATRKLFRKKKLIPKYVACTLMMNKNLGVGKQWNGIYEAEVSFFLSPILVLVRLALLLPQLRVLRIWKSRLSSCAWQGD